MEKCELCKREHKDNRKVKVDEEFIILCERCIEHLKKVCD